MATILDQYGNPIKKEDLLEEEARPSVTGVRQIISSYQTGGLNPKRLAEILRQADEGDAVAYLELAEEVEEKDTHYASVLGTRKRAVSQLEINVIPASDDEIDQKAASLVEDWLNRDQLEDELFHILDAIGKGFSVTEILWDVNSDVWMPRDLKWRDPRWFEFDQNDGETLYLRGDLGEKIELKPYKYIIHRAQAKSGVPIRGGVIRPCVWMWLFKNFSIKDWVIFCEAYGQPIRVGKYGSSATAADKNVLMRAVANIGSDAAAIIPESMKIEFIESTTKGGTIDAFERLCNFCDKQISKAVLGQTTTTDAQANGLAGNQAHNDVRGDIERSDAKQLAATINRQLIPMLIALNMGQLKRLPRIKIGRQDDIDISKLAEVSERSVKMGMKVSASKLREKLGLPAPEDEADELKIQDPSPSNPSDKATASAISTKVLASQVNQNGRDAIDDAVDDMGNDWEQIMTPMVDQIEQSIEKCQSFDEVEQALLSLAGEMNTDDLVDRLEKMSAKIRMAGIAGIALSQE